MHEDGSNYLGFGLYFFFIVILILAFSASIFYINQNKKNKEAEELLLQENLSDALKQDKTKDFIYYIDEEVLSEELRMTYKVPVINLDSEEARNVNQEMAEYASKIKSTLVKSTDDTCTYKNDSSIAKTLILDYGVYSYQEYKTLFVREMDYSCMNGFSSFSKVRAYTFNVLTGEKITFLELMRKYKTTLTEVLEKVNKALEDQQTDLESTPNIKIEETVKSLKDQETYAFYIDGDGNLILNYVVKTNSVDYNDNMMVSGK